MWIMAEKEKIDGCGQGVVKKERERTKDDERLQPSLNVICHSLNSNLFMGPNPKISSNLTHLQIYMLHQRHHMLHYGKITFE